MERAGEERTRENPRQQRIYASASPAHTKRYSGFAERPDREAQRVRNLRDHPHARQIQSNSSGARTLREFVTRYRAKPGGPPAGVRASERLQ